MRPHKKNSELGHWVVILALSLIILISCEMMGESHDLFEISFLIGKIMGLALGLSLFLSDLNNMIWNYIP